MPWFLLLYSISVNLLRILLVRLINVLKILKQQESSETKYLNQENLCFPSIEYLYCKQLMYTELQIFFITNITLNIFRDEWYSEFYF